MGLLKNYRDEKARLQGQAVSQARRIRPVAEVQPKSLRAGVPAPIPGAVIKDCRGRLMQHWTDGSLRRCQ